MDARYQEHMKAVLMRWKFSLLPENYLTSKQYPIDVIEETYHRVNRFHSYLVPWVRRAFDLKGARVIEVGSGTGSSTLAFAPYVDHIHCFELEENPIAVAKERLRFWGIENISFETGLFDRSAPLLAGDRQFDIVLLIAVLEHVHFHEFREILETAMKALRPGGVIVIGETPNRLSFHDSHSSQIDFFQWLPPEIKQEYYRFSPRAHFAHDIGDTIREHGANSLALQERLVRWGRGVSFHDFELVLSPKVHDMIVLDGWEDEILPMAPVSDDDEVILDIFRRAHVKANKAFARSWMYLVIRKPDCQ